MGKKSEFQKWYQEQPIPACPEEAWNTCWEYWKSRVVRATVDIKTHINEYHRYENPEGIRESKLRYGKEELLASLDKYTTLEETKEGDTINYRITIDVIKK